jgi:uncharacterized protein (UPF0305 family)
MQNVPGIRITSIFSKTPYLEDRQNGILVDSNNQPIADRIKELKRKINEPNDRQEKEDLEEQLRQLYNEAKVLIDLRGKLRILSLSVVCEVTKSIFFE